MHEIISRAQTRGRPPAERFNRRICIMLHPAVHLLVTRNVVRIVMLEPDIGADGAVLFQLRDDTSPLWRAFARQAISAHTTLRWESRP